jgi:drug/metabolite transporter (DMT)-like permease
MHQKTLAHLLLLAVALIYSANYVWAKEVMPNPIPPNAFILLRAGGATALFWLFLKKYWILPERLDLLRLLLCGLCGVTINQLCFFNGLAITAPLHAAIIMILTPVIVTSFSILVLKQKTTSLQWFGIAIGLIGAIGFIGYGKNNPMHGASALGDLFILINAVSYSFYLIMVKPLMHKYHPLSIIPWVFTFGLLGVLPFGWSELSNQAHWDLSLYQWAIVAFVVVCVTFLTYLFNIIAIQKLSPTHAGVYIYLQPPIAALFSVWAGLPVANLFTLPKILFTALIVIGVILVSRKIN